jgi:hypothetical protein
MQRDHFKNGTAVWMKIDNESTRTAQEIYNQYAGPEHDYAFAKTVVPVRLAQYSGDRLALASRFLTFGTFRTLQRSLCCGRWP